MELAWLLIFGLAVWVGVIGALWIFWPWREIPAILRDTTATLNMPSARAEDIPPTLPEGADWYHAPEPPPHPTQRNVYWPNEPGA